MKKLINPSLLSAMPCFTAAARNLSFTRAASDLHITAGAVSQQIRQLEEKLGCLLFNRLGRGLSLTPNGELLLIAAEKSLEIFSEVIEKLGQSSGPLIVNCAPSFALLWLMPRLRNFHTDHPDIEIKLVAEFQTLDRTSLAAGHIDAAIRYDTTSYRGVEVIPLMAEYLMPVASQQYISDHQEAIRTPGFVGATLLTDDSPWDGAPNQVEWSAWLDVAEQNAQRSTASRSFNLFMMALEAARNHQGICLGRNSLIRDEILSGEIVSFAKLAVRSPANYKLISSRTSDPRVKSFSAWLVNECKTFEAENRLLL